MIPRMIVIGRVFLIVLMVLIAIAVAQEVVGL